MANLVYFCVFYNKDYFKLLEILLLSLKFYSSTESFDILVLTSPEFKNSVEELSSKFSLKIDIMTINLTTIFQAACARLQIFSYKNITNYEKILYLDTDIIIKSDLAPIFNFQLNDILYGIESGHLYSPSFGNQFFDFKKIDAGKTGLNSGTLLFNNCLQIRDLFSRIQGHINAFTDAGATVPYCMDQPFINFHAVRDELYDNQLLNPYVSLYEGTDNVANYSTSIICHFSFPIGNFWSKYERMVKFLVKLADADIPCDIESIKNKVVGNSYSWGYNFIKFTSSELQTTWGNGIYEIKGNNCIIANWNGCHHFLKFNNEYTEYIGFRTKPSDFIFCSGNITTGLTSYLNNWGFYKFEGYSQQLSEQINDLINIIKPNSVNNILEIGFNAGHSADIILKNNPNAKLVSFDLGEWEYNMPAKEYIDDLYPGRHTLIFGNSITKVPEFTLNNPDMKFDVIFIDGGHSYFVANSDVINCSKLAHKDTIVALDDTMFTDKWVHPFNIGPNKTWTEHLNANKISEICRKDYCDGRGMAWGKYVFN